VFYKPNFSMLKPFVGKKDYYAEDYLVKKGNAHYAITFKYAEPFKEEYYSTAEKILNSFDLPESTCTEDYKGLSEDQLMLIYGN